MQTVKNPLSISIIYWVTNITFWIYVAASMLLLVIAFLFMFKIFDETQLHVGVPIGINILEQGKAELNNTIVNVEFVEMYGKIHFMNTPPFIGRIYSWFILIITSIFFFIFLTFRRFINNVHKGVFFELKNIALLKRISYALAGIWGFTVFYAYFQYFYLVKNIQFESLESTGDVQTYPVILLVALFLWVLSHIFMKGCKLQEENNYTI